MTSKCPVCGKLPDVYSVSNDGVNFLYTFECKDFIKCSGYSVDNAEAAWNKNVAICTRKEKEEVVPA